MFLKPNHPLESAETHSLIPSKQTNRPRVYVRVCIRCTRTLHRKLGREATWPEADWKRSHGESSRILRNLHRIAHHLCVYARREREQKQRDNQECKLRKNRCSRVTRKTTSLSSPFALVVVVMIVVVVVTTPTHTHSGLCARHSSPLLSPSIPTPPLLAVSVERQKRRLDSRSV